MLGLTLASCQDDFDTLNVPSPVATLKPNSTISQVKEQYWDDATNYARQISDSLVISGRVISSDAAGNIYKSLVIQDATGALSMSINSSYLFDSYRIGQEIVLNLKDMYIGKYNGLQQLGFPQAYQDTYEVSFMPLPLFQEHAQLNGNPEPARVDTILVSSFSELATDPAGLRQWQSQLVRFNNCHFALGGQAAFTDGHKVNTSRELTLADGSVITVRTSGYANFWADALPAANCDVVGILSYYGSTGWQLLLNDRQGVMNVGNPTVTVPQGDKENPYTASEAISIINSGAQKSGWVEGYIVGAVAPGVQSVKSNSDIEFTKDVVMDNSLVIGPTADCKDFSQCLVVMLPQDSKLRLYGNLVDHPDNYLKHILIKGSFGKVLDTYGLLNNSGSASEFEIEGLEIPDDNIGSGNGSEEKPYSVTQVLGMGNPGTTAWVKGFIVGWVEGQSISTGAHFETPATVASNILIANSPDVRDYTQCVAVQLVAQTDIRTNVNLMDNPGNLGKTLEIQGALEKYFGVVGVKAPTAYKLSGTGSGGEQPNPPSPGGGDAFTGTTADLSGTPTKYYEAFTTAGGWSAVNSQLLQGGTEDNSPVFAFLKSADTFAPCLNGKSGSAGVLTSPLILGPLNTLSFKYAQPYADTKCSLTIDILQGDKVVASDLLENNGMTKFQVYDYSHTFSVSGDFVIRITNNCPSASTSNKDRTAVWAISWTR